MEELVGRIAATLHSRIQGREVRPVPHIDIGVMLDQKPALDVASLRSCNVERRLALHVSRIDISTHCQQLQHCRRLLEESCFMKRCIVVLAIESGLRINIGIRLSQEVKEGHIADTSCQVQGLTGTHLVVGYEPALLGQVHVVQEPRQDRSRGRCRGASKVPGAPPPVCIVHRENMQCMAMDVPGLEPKAIGSLDEEVEDEPGTCSIGTTNSPANLLQQLQSLFTHLGEARLAMDLNCLEPDTSAARAVPRLLLRFDDGEVIETVVVRTEWTEWRVGSRKRPLLLIPPAYLAVIINSLNLRARKRRHPGLRLVDVKSSLGRRAEMEPQPRFL
mmetsp:Transcript_73180/g.171655  ORF Transcript_73180/g.171655 Transcript_73180/m.171655 type:complete len:332 (+) Transcript_73180:829-1824(+)